MANTTISSLSDADTRLAALNTEILKLETERSELLRAELANAESRVEEIEAFIGVYRASSSLGGSAPKKKRAAKKKRAGKKTRGPGRPRKAKKASKKPAADKKGRKKPAAAPKKQGRRKRVSAAERSAKIKGLVKSAGKSGISARKLASDNDFPYGAVLKELNDASTYKKVGEKRDRLYFLK